MSSRCRDAEKADQEDFLARPCFRGDRQQASTLPSGSAGGRDATTIAYVEENNLSGAISGIRQALGEGRKDQRSVVTVARRVYRFMAERMRQDAVIRKLEIIGEAVKQPSDETKQRRPRDPLEAYSSSTLTN